MKSYCYATKGLAIRYNDTTVSAPNGLADLINDELGNNILYLIIHLSGSGIEISFTNRTKARETTYHSFVNGVKTEGGTHVNALKDARNLTFVHP